MPDHLIVIRSAATDYDLQGRVRGSLDLPPCPEGLAEARAAAKRLADSPPTAIYTAPTACAEETARIIADRCGLTPKRLDLLENLDLGLWQGKLVAEIRKLQPRLYRQWQEDPWSVSPPEGEQLDEARERVEAVLEKLFRKHPGGRIAVVVPPPLDAVIRWLVSGEPLGDLWRRDACRDPVAELPVAAQWQPAGSQPLAAPAAPLPPARAASR